MISDGTEAIWKQAREIEHGGKKIDMDKANEIIQNEIEIISAIQTHGRVPKIIDSGYIYDDGKKVNVIVMERIEGPMLKDYLNEKGNLSLQEVMDVSLQICEILEFMADRNPPTFHRDLKDTNVIMRPGFGVVLIDYGTSKEIDTGDSVSIFGRW